MNDISKYIKDMRILRGLSVRSVAAACNVSPSTVSRWESGEINNMGRDKIVLLAKALGVNPDIISGAASIVPMSSAEYGYVEMMRDSYNMAEPTGSLIRAVLKLNDDQKFAMLNMIEAMTAGDNGE